MPRPRILVAGIGNIFLGDDAFGVEVVRRLLEQPPPAEQVRVVDFGIRGFDLACAILEDYEDVILVDAWPGGGKPGTLYLIEPDLESLAAGPPACTLEAHWLSPTRVLEYVRQLGGRLPCVHLVGCQPATFGSDEQPQMGLSAEVAAAIDPAIAMVRGLVETIPGAAARLRQRV